MIPDGFRGKFSRSQGKEDPLARERFHHPQRVAGKEDPVSACARRWRLERVSDSHRFEWYRSDSQLTEMGVLPGGVREERFAVTVESGSPRTGHDAKIDLLRVHPHQTAVAAPVQVELHVVIQRCRCPEMRLERHVFAAPVPETRQTGLASNHRVPSVRADNGGSSRIFSMAGSHATIGQDIVNRLAFDDTYPARPGVVEQRCIQQTAADGHRRGRHGDTERMPARGGEAGTVNRVTWQLPNLSSYAESFEDRPAIRVEDIPADLVAGEPGMLEQRHAQSSLRTTCRRCRAGRPATDDDHVELIHDGQRQYWR